MSKKDDTGHSSLLYLRIVSLEDLCRFACNFDFSAESILFSKDKGGGKLIALGEHVGNATIAYYIPSTPKTRTLRYMQNGGSEKESIEFVGKPDQSTGNTTFINVIGVDLSAFSGAPKITDKDVACVGLDSPDDLIKAVIKKSVETERTLDTYCFEYKGKRYLGAFGIIEALEDDRKLFYYSLFNSKTLASFAKYSYGDNKLEFTGSIGEHSSMYVKIINLAEPFPFFNTPD